MFNIELVADNFDNVLYDAQKCLEEALGRDCSKIEKDCAMNKAIGMLDVLWRIVNIYEVDNENDEK